MVYEREKEDKKKLKLEVEKAAKQKAVKDEQNKFYGYAIVDGKKNTIFRNHLESQWVYNLTSNFI